MKHLGIYCAIISIWGILHSPMGLTSAPHRQANALQISIDKIDASCHGDSSGLAYVRVTGGQAPYDILWSSQPPQRGDTARMLPAGTYTVRVRDATGCADSAQVRIDHPPPLSLMPHDVQHASCERDNGQAAVIVSGGTPPYRYIWLPTGANQPIATRLQGARIYSVVVADSLGCADILDIPIHNIPTPLALFRTTPPLDEPILLSEARIEFTELSAYAKELFWDFGDGQQARGRGRIIHGYTEPGEYLIRLKAYAPERLCVDSFSQRLIVVPDGKLYMPNVFSPNGDHLNERFFPIGEGIKQYEMDIFNRWGEHIARIDQSSEGWDGRLDQGDMAREGVYVYSLNAFLYNGTRISKSGSFILIR